jgi:hypothetical protein
MPGVSNPEKQSTFDGSEWLPGALDRLHLEQSARPVPSAACTVPVLLLAQDILLKISGSMLLAPIVTVPFPL